MFLKQSTASQSVLIGPFLDSTDGDTAETGLTIANTDIRLSKNGGNMAAKNSGGGTHDEAGWYTITLDATDTNTVGTLQVSVDVSGALPVWHEFQVVEEAIYDALFGSSATAFDSSGNVTLAAITHTGAVIPTVSALTGHTAQSGDSFARIGVNGAGLSAVPWNAAWDAQVQSECADALNAYDPPTNAELEARTLVAASYATEANVNQRSTHNAADVWSVPVRTLTANTNLNDPTAATIATAVLTTQMTQSYASDGTAPTLAQALFAIQQFLQERAVSGTTVTVKQLDGSTTAMTFTLDDGTTPTSITRAT